MLKSVTDIWGSFFRFGVPKSSISALKSQSEGPKWRPGCDFGAQGCFLISWGSAECFFHKFWGTFLGVFDDFWSHFWSHFWWFFWGSIFVWKSMIFWELMFYVSESITFEGRGSIWRVSGTAKIAQKLSRRGSKKKDTKHVEKWKKNRKNARGGPSRSAAYTTRIWCFQFFCMLIFMIIWGQTVIKFEVWGRLLEAKKEGKMMTFWQSAKSSFVL